MALRATDKVTLSELLYSNHNGFSAKNKKPLVSIIGIRYIIRTMRIDKIELIGFKSFSDRTAFLLHPGITSIVGPNGCGKSNVVDAFRWVLGEQSAKSLRGEKMEEVIFNGTISKKPKGMAEVTMTISGLNTAQQTASDDNGENSSDAVSVTRRLYRSGDSEYLLNKTQCRLKDIKDLFLDTGLEVRSYSILEQDRITEILNSKPQERRFLIEEVAGIMKYNARKKEALSKLESSRINLQRINDIIVEVKKQINFLDRLAKKAERYKKLFSEMHAIELKIAKRDYELLKESFGQIGSEYTIHKEDESLKKAALSKIETETETKRLQLLEKEKELEHIQLEFQNLEKEISELEKIIAVARTERNNHQEYLTKLHQQDNDYTRKDEELLLRQKELEKTEAELSVDLERQKDLLRDKADYVRSMEEDLSEHEDLLDRKRREIFRISEELSTLKNNQSRLQSNLEGLQHRENSAVKEAENVKKALEELDLSLRDTETGLLEKNNDILFLNEKKTIKINELSVNKNRMEQLRDILSKLKEELAGNISRIVSLKELLFDETTRDFLSGDLSFNLIASLLDVMEIDDTYEKAIESVLSEKVNSFILPSYYDIENAVLSLKEKGLGRTAFIPQKPAIHGAQKDVPEGVLGKAVDFIQVKEDFSEVVKSLFENILIVRDLKTALDLLSSGHMASFVTLDGDVVEPSGAVIAGEIKGVFKRKREIRELESSVDTLKTKIEHHQAELNATLQLIETRETDLRDIETAIVNKEKEVSILKMTAENYR
jgi:chromosome segregation protein